MGNKAKDPDFLDSDRIIEDQIPQGVPIEVEISNLKTDSLLRDIEIKVTNTAKKPIYFLQLGIVLPNNLSPDGYPIDFPLTYGRPELIKFENSLEPNDTPILPGERFVFKIAETNLVAFEGFVAEGKITQTEIKRVYLMFRHLNFGDKTGFSGDGSAVPYIRKERSTNDCYERKDLVAFELAKYERRKVEPSFLVLLEYTRLAVVSTNVLVDDRQRLPKSKRIFALTGKLIERTVRPLTHSWPEFCSHKASLLLTFI